MRDFLLVDGKNLLFRTTCANQALQHEGRSTGGIYGFMRIILHLGRFTEGAALRVCWEGSNNWRFKRFPAYKGSRVNPLKRKNDSDFDARAELASQFPALQELLLFAGIPQLTPESGECDDVLYTLAKEVSQEGKSSVIFTQDKDLYQATAIPGCHVLRQNSDHGYDYIHCTKVYEEFKVKPEQLPLLKALAGDASDNIPGVPNIGKVRAAKLIAAYPTYDELIAAANGDSKSWVGSAAQQRNVLKTASDVKLYEEIIKLHECEVLGEREVMPEPEKLKGGLESLGLVSLSSPDFIDRLCSLSKWC